MLLVHPSSLSIIPAARDVQFREDESSSRASRGSVCMCICIYTRSFAYTRAKLRFLQLLLRVCTQKCENKKVEGAGRKKKNIKCRTITRACKLSRNFLTCESIITPAESRTHT